MEIVKFHRSWRNYNRGDIAGFAPETARHLVQQGVCTYHDEEDEVAEEPQTRNVGTGQRRRKKSSGRRSLKGSANTQTDDSEIETK